MKIQSKLDWEFGKGKPRINPERLKEEILRAFFSAGFVVDFGNGIIAENYEEYKQIMSIINDVVHERKPTAGAGGDFER
ncbi:hypothetical protein DRO24_00330 [Candidatus Bathyarchaeota archaeon]|nr:MAG: hypothetical protein DRO24_00330 [Candidatus Bathyarchaeota archaeon]